MANEIEKRWYNGEKSDAPIIDRHGWQYVPHPNPTFGGHWLNTAPVQLDGFVLTNKNAKPK